MCILRFKDTLSLSCVFQPDSRNSIGRNSTLPFVFTVHCFYFNVAREEVLDQAKNKYLLPLMKLNIAPNAKFVHIIMSCNGLNFDTIFSAHQEMQVVMPMSRFTLLVFILLPYNFCSRKYNHFIRSWTLSSDSARNILRSCAAYVQHVTV